MINRNIYINLALAIFSLLVMLLVAEICFRINGRYIGFMERYGKPYAPLYTAGEPTWYHIYRPYSERRDYSVYDDHSIEFSNTFTANNEGLLDKDFHEHKGKDTMRIMLIGDSFIQGIGAPYDSSCPKRLEAILNKRYQGKPSIEVWDCGIGGSDPFYEYVLLANKLLKYHPDYIVEAVNNTDITDIVIRGGMDRFSPDSTVVFHRQSKIEKIYAYSYLVRRIVHDVLKYNWMFMTDKELKEAKDNSVQQLESCLLSFDSLCSLNHIPFLVSVQPMKEDFDKNPQPYMSDVARFCDSIHMPVIDIKKSFEKEGINADQAIALYWNVDMHFKPEGYATYARYLSVPIISHIDSIRKP